MAATTFLPASPRLPHRRIIPRTNNKPITRRVFTKAQQGESEGKSVDENMIVLKMRIKKMKVAETNLEAASDWKEWEKKIFTNYHEGVCDSVEMLQAYLMKMRPSVAVGLLALIAISVPLSSSVVMLNALKLAKGLLAGCHVCIDIDF